MPRVAEPNTTSNNEITTLIHRSSNKPLAGFRKRFYGGRYALHTSSPNVYKFFIVDAWAPIQIAQQTRSILFSVDNLSSRTKRLLGPNCVDRFDKFRNYTIGWGDNGLPLSFRSVAAMEYFISSISNFYTAPSIFLTNNGNLQLEWENVEGSHIELEFFHDKIEFYIEAIDSEGQVTFNEDSFNFLLDMVKNYGY